MPEGNLLLFAMDSSRSLGERIAAELARPLSPHEERAFDDGEHKSRPLTTVRGADVHVISSLHATAQESVNDKFCRLAFFIGALRDAGAKRLTAVLPYLCYARKDRKSQPRDPTTTRYVAQILEAVGIDCVVTIDVHNLAAFQNAFRRPTVHLEAAPLLAGTILAALPGDSLAVCSPDAGGLKRADQLRRLLEDQTGKTVGIAMMEKRRALGKVSGDRLFGEVDGCAVVIPDDLIATGSTMVRAAQACRAQGASAVVAAATHGVFTGKAAEVVADPAIDRFIVTDTVAPLHLPPDLVARKVTVVDTAPLIAGTIRHLHGGG